jgi:hypothetical protein
LTNDFSWSKSRHEKFSECRRAYYYHYYLSWGGWGAEAPASVRELYLLKRLGNRYTWVGSVVHEAIRDTLTHLRAGRAVEPSTVIARWHQQMREDFLFSKARKYASQKGRKEFNGLVEHEYSEDVPVEEWKTLWQNTQAALEWFFQSPWPKVAKSLKKEQWLEVDFMDFEKSIFFLEGTKVFAVPDFAYVDGEGNTVIVDWKTGRAREGYDDQILGYALYLESRYGLSLSKMKAALVYLNEGLEKWVGLEEPALKGFKEKFTSSTSQMRALLADPEKNVPKEEADFTPTDDLSVCARCVFRRPCGREGSALASMSHRPP